MAKATTTPIVPKTARRTKQSSAKADPDAGKFDQREALYNGGAIGAAHEIAVGAERITSSRGLMLDIDLKLIKSGGLFETVGDDPFAFYAQVFKPLLARHSLLKKAEVRMSGGGLHALLWLDEPIEFFSDDERDRWAITTQIVQYALPSDPRAPGITAMTRPVGAINSKNGARVVQLAPGAPCTAGEIEAFRDELNASPFKSLVQLWTGSDRLEPCPCCRAEGSSLAVLDHRGRCYKTCGTVSIETFVSEALVDAPE
ncbi:hypothetical protein Pla175_43770 [Pirellulimonas nuda]|uniref:Uncharacterized protein n=1 Tax=Pirellulimonas nuda TaxID=2528009 RepID=A0A518DHL4_9BACT|nr:hypothetical protein [Pirellulimonas nuda]QDU90963.1 hypothetical protein Pla175_43770 [Pirellulimonas nuda]